MFSLFSILFFSEKFQLDSQMVLSMPSSSSTLDCFLMPRCYFLCQIVNRFTANPMNDMSWYRLLVVFNCGSRDHPLPENLNGIADIRNRAIVCMTSIVVEINKKCRNRKIHYHENDVSLWYWSGWSVVFQNPLYLTLYVCWELCRLVIYVSSHWLYCKQSLWYSSSRNWET